MASPEKEVPPGGQPDGTTGNRKCNYAGYTLIPDCQGKTAPASNVIEFLPGAATEQDKPHVYLPRDGRNEREFALDIAQHVPPDKLFRLDGQIVEISNDDELGADEVEIEPFGGKTVKFNNMTSSRFATWVEDYVTTGVSVKKGKGAFSGYEFRAKTMTTEHATRMLAGDNLRKGLNKIVRILDVPIPIRTISGQIVYPEPGYNKQLQLYCDPGAPQIQKMDQTEAVAVINEQLYGEFCFKNEQSLIHAIARLLTPYLKGIMGFHAKVPLWWFDANRPGAGKDYCNGVTQIVYQGRAWEDAPIGESSEETKKRITAALRAGRRAMHFANCQDHLQDPQLMTAISDYEYCTRGLGRNDASSDLRLRNEIDFSLSANIGMTCREDFRRRRRRISLAFYGEHENERTFNQSDLWGWILRNRSRVLSAINSLFQRWLAEGCPDGQTPFTSYPQWAMVVGGIMAANGLGNPCTPDSDEEFGGDLKLRAMRALYETACEIDPESWWNKSQIYDAINTAQQEGDDRMDYFGLLVDDDRRSTKDKDSINRNRTKLGIALKEYDQRILSGIRMMTDTSEKRAERRRIKFFKESF
jgi:hypothetical protein